MLNWFRNWLEIYDDETELFLWTVLLRILLLSVIVILNNYAETTFLQRYGVEKLPLMYFISPILGVLIMGLMAGLMVRWAGARLLSYLFLAFGVATAVIRFLIPYNIDLIYPILFLLKVQCEAILGMLFLNLANDLFNIRQSKRLFPLIYAGGYIGYIGISFLTPAMSKAVTFDNLLLICTGLTILAAVVVKRMGSLFPTLLVTEKPSDRSNKKKGMRAQVKDAWPFIKDSMLIKILVLLFLLPNIALVILNFQFNFVVNEHFATEASKLTFFGYFRGVLGIINLILLLFVGKLYNRFGLPVALMFHPLNYLIAFLAFFFSFSWLSGIYARLSTQILKSTVFIPARSVLMGLLPERQRAIMRPFLRGVVIRAGGMLGSLLLMGFGMLMSPKYLSLVAIPFVAAWIAAPIILKKNYSKILLDLVSKNVLDLKSMEKNDVEGLFRDKKIREELIQVFCASSGKDCLWYADLLKSLAVEELDENILRVLKHQDDRTRIGLLRLLSSDPEGEAMEVLSDLIDYGKPELTIAVLSAANRLALERSSQINQEAYQKGDSSGVKAMAVAGLCRDGSQEFCRTIQAWLQSEDAAERKAGVMAAGESGNRSFEKTLRDLLQDGKNEAIVDLIIRSLHKTGAADLNRLVAPFLAHEKKAVREAALKAYAVSDDDALRTVIKCMGDPANTIFRLAKEKISQASYQNGQLLIESLSIPRRKLREGIFELLERLNIGDIELFRFAKKRIGESCGLIALQEYFKSFDQGPLRDLVIDHLKQKSALEIENVLRVMALQDKSGRIKIIVRGILSADEKQRANSIEALDDSMDRSLSRLLVPLLDNTSNAQTLSLMKKYVQLPPFENSNARVLSYFAERKDWLSAALVLNLFAEQGVRDIDRQLIAELEESQNDHILRVTGLMRKPLERSREVKEKEMDSEVAISDKILLLKKIDIFEGLNVAELAAVGSVTEEVSYPKDQIVIKIGELGETMFLILDGEVSVLIGDTSGKEIEVDRIRSGDYFGEMALFENIPRTATIRTEAATRLLVLHKQEFNEIVREYPQIALEICKVLSARIRKLHDKIKAEKTG